jgi:disulfide oxidoreductase YuzD
MLRALLFLSNLLSALCLHKVDQGEWGKEILEWLVEAVHEGMEDQEPGLIDILGDSEQPEHDWVRVVEDIKEEQEIYPHYN